MSEQLFTVGEIFRLRLLKNHRGQPYSSKATVYNVVMTLNPVKKRTAHGEARCLTMAQIEAYNKQRIIN